MVEESSTQNNEGHYNDDNVSAHYESAFFYSDLKYRDWLLSKLVPHLSNTQATKKIVDIGGGSGNFTQALAEVLFPGTNEKILCVDPFQEMLKFA